MIAIVDGNFYHQVPVRLGRVQLAVSVVYTRVLDRSSTKLLLVDDTLFGPSEGYRSILQIKNSDQQFYCTCSVCGTWYGITTETG